MAEGYTFRTLLWHLKWYWGLCVQPDLFPLHIHDTYVKAITLDRLHKKKTIHWTISPPPTLPLGAYRLVAPATGYHV